MCDSTLMLSVLCELTAIVILNEKISLRPEIFEKDIPILSPSIEKSNLALGTYH